MVNDLDLLLRAAVDGLGMAYTTEAQAEPFLRSGQLVRVLEDWSPTFEGLCLYYPGHRQVPPSLRALIELVSSGAEAPAIDRSIANPFIEA
jgi:DNA-binding transcriptional LysR family regulator